MNQLNSIIIEGNVVELLSGLKVCIISVAVNRTYKNSKGEYEDEVSYFEIECFGKMVEFCINNCVKGRGIRVVGRLKQNRWSDETGKVHSNVVIYAEHIEFKPLMKTTTEKEIKLEKMCF